MRQMLIWAPAGSGDAIVRATEDNDCELTLQLDGRAGEQGPVDVVITQVPNRALGGLANDLSQVDGMHASFLPEGSLSLSPPVEQPSSAVTDVTLRSPIEIFLSSLQSLGSWKGFLAYAAVSGAITWIGFYTDTAYLLVGGMLISPLAAPAMNAAVATARGDATEFARAARRYVLALATGSTVAALFSWMFGLSLPTQTMSDVASISSAAALLPLTAGVAGAINVAQSSRSSLVSGAATGMLVAAALAPPMALLGMAPIIGDWEMFRSAAFLLVLQLVGINIAGAIVFRVVGLGPSGSRYPHGRAPLGWAVGAASAVVLVALVAMQLWTPTTLQRRSVAADAAVEARRVVEELPGVSPVDVQARFAQSHGQGRRTLLVTIYARSSSDRGDPRQLEAEATDRVLDELGDSVQDSVTLVDVSVLPAAS